jgi:hypothetical protein
MKKRSLKNLQLNKASISNLNSKYGGVADWPETAKYCPVPNEPSQWITCDDGCDFPTINDSCFSWCDDKCNDF